jgi:hypothetical protein
LREDIREEMAAEEEKKEIDRENARQKRRMEDQRRALAKDYDEDGVKAIETLMEKHGIHDYEVGRKLYAAEAPTMGDRNEAPSSSSRWDMPTDKELLADPSKWANQMAEQTIRELRQQHGIGRR